MKNYKSNSQSFKQIKQSTSKAKWTKEACKHIPTILNSYKLPNTTTDFDPATHDNTQSNEAHNNHTNHANRVRHDITTQEKSHVRDAQWQDEQPRFRIVVDSSTANHTINGHAE